MKSLKDSLLQEIHEFSLWGEHADRFEYLASGKDGNVYSRDDIVIKVFKEDGKSRDDGMKLHRLENSIYYPKLEAYTNDFMVCERIYGDTFHELVGHDNELQIRYENEIKEAIFDAHLSGLEAFDLHNHNIMLTNDGHIRIVDLGRFGTEATTLQFGIFRKIFGNSSKRHHPKHRRHRHHSSSSNRHHRRHSSSHSYARRSYSSS